MTSRERVLMALNHQEADRVPIHDSLWPSTIERWRCEGLPRDVNPAEFFDFEMLYFGADTSPRFPVRIIEETEEYITTTTESGGVLRNRKDYASTPQIVDYPVKTREDWERIKERLKPGPDRVDWKGRGLGATFEDARGPECIWETGRMDTRLGLPGFLRAKAQGKFVAYIVPVGYSKLLAYLDVEQMMMLIATDAEWVREMYEVDAQLCIDMYEIMVEGGFEFDGAFLACDLGYRNGLLFSPRHYDQQLRPAFKRLFDYFRGKGMPVLLHSCGCVRELVPRWVEDGLTCLNPLEVKAGMDLIELNDQFGDRLAFWGGIDVRAMAHPDPKVIEEEIAKKIPIAKKGGGYIYHSDHSIPDNVSFAQYQRVLELVKKYGAY